MDASGATERSLRPCPVFRREDTAWRLADSYVVNVDDPKPRSFMAMWLSKVSGSGKCGRAKDGIGSWSGKISLGIRTSFLAEDGSSGSSLGGSGSWNSCCARMAKHFLASMLLDVRARTCYQLLQWNKRQLEAKRTPLVSIASSTFVLSTIYLYECRLPCSRPWPPGQHLQVHRWKNSHRRRP